MDRINEYSFAKFFVFFMMLQPIIDILTFVGIEQFSLSITPGIVIRMIVLTIGSILILSRIVKDKNKKIMVYLLILIAYMCANLFISYLNKPIFNLFSEVSMIAKALYTIFMFVILIMSIQIIFKNHKKNNTKRLFPLIISANALIINVTFLIATLTQTGKQTYNALYKTGHTAWFFAGNEIGSILSILLPLLLLSALLVKKKVYKFILWIIFITTILTMITVGTKVGSFSVLITLIIANVSNLIIYLLSKRYKKIKTVGTNKDYILLLLSLIAFSISFPYLPATTNSSEEYQALIERNETQTEDGEQEKNESDTPLIEEDFFGESNSNEEVTISDVAYSGRSGFLELNKLYYDEAPLIQKLFGMGYAGNYETSPKLVERDLHDMFFQFGIIGTIIQLIPFAYYAIKVLKEIFSDLLSYINIKYILLFTSIMLGAGISFVGGHVFYSPAVSIYLCYVLAYLIVLTNKRKADSIEQKK